MEKLWFHSIFRSVSVIEDMLIFIVSLQMLVRPNFQDQIKKEFQISEQNPGTIDFGQHKLPFSLQDIFNLINKKTDSKLVDSGKGVNANVMYFLNKHAQQTIIFVGEILKSHIKGKHFQKKFEETEIYNFVIHLRNGAAHNNKFRIDKKDEPDRTWRGKVIKRSKQQGKEVFPSFINPFELPILVSDLSNELKKYEK
jgi:hypothetical protein